MDQLWSQFDRDNSGQLDHSEGIVMIKHFLPEATADDLEKEFILMDTDNQGSLSKKEVC